MKTRRQFLIGSAAVAGGFVIGCRVDRSVTLSGDPQTSGEPTWLTPYVVVDAEGITLIAPRAEMGQGIHTTLAALVAEELDVGLGAVRVEHGPASESYSNTIFYPPNADAPDGHRPPTQATGGQTSIRDAFVKMRQAGAAARTVLVQAAAERLRTSPESLTTRDGAVVDAKGREIPYVDLAEAAARIEPPTDPPIKPPSEWRILGNSQPRVDMVAKCTGTAEYAIDLQLPGMLYATVVRNPRLGGRMRGFDATKASGLRGVEGVLAMDSGVIVVATNTWYALRAAEQIEFDWGPAPYPETTAEHRRQIEEAFGGQPYSRPRVRGDVTTALTDARILEGQYWVPYLAHATMEPMNATARLADGRLDIWAGNQFPTLAVKVGAHLSGLPEEAVHVHTPYMGGGFGRRFEMDDVEAAVVAALAFPGRPIRVTYSREEDFSHDTYRPMASARFRAAVADGRPVALDIDLSAPSLFLSGQRRRRELTGESSTAVAKEDVSITAAIRRIRYQFDHFRVTAYRAAELLPIGWWRSVGASQNCFFLESIVDELAHAAGADPLELRLSLLRHPASRRVLESVGDMSNWGSTLPEGHARGLAYCLFKGLATAQVLEIIHTDAGIKLHKAYAAVDVGQALDPRNIEAQVQGALLFGLSSAIHGEITVSRGMVDQTNFDGYPLLSLKLAPTIRVRILEIRKEIGGVGESATPTSAPALGNAIFAATGQRIRELPFGRTLRFG